MLNTAESVLNTVESVLDTFEISRNRARGGHVTRLGLRACWSRRLATRGGRETPCGRRDAGLSGNPLGRNIA